LGNALLNGTLNARSEDANAFFNWLCELFDLTPQP
jgi:hypothetical protein